MGGQLHLDTMDVVSIRVNMPGPFIWPVLSDVSYGSFKWLENILDQVTFNYELDNLRFLSSRLIMKKIKKI